MLLECLAEREEVGSDGDEELPSPGFQDQGASEEAVGVDLRSERMVRAVLHHMH